MSSFLALLTNITLASKNCRGQMLAYFSTASVAIKKFYCMTPGANDIKYFGTNVLTNFCKLRHAALENAT